MRVDIRAKKVCTLQAKFEKVPDVAGMAENFPGGNSGFLLLKAAPY